MQVLPFHQCGHVHDPREWAPVVSESGVSYPSTEEAEYSASLCFTLVAAASHWAVDKGFAVLRIQRLPPVQPSGDWRGLLTLPAETFRADSMALMAAHVGLSPYPGSATCVQVQAVWVRDKPLPCDVVYIGHSHFSHRLPVTCWENPFVAGRDGSAELVVFRYMQWFPRSGLQGKLFQLCGKRLACDCGATELCHGDFLLGLLLQGADSPTPQLLPAQTARVRRVLLAAAAGLQIPAGIAYPISQASIASAAQSLLQGGGPSERFSLQWPYMEDLVNSPHFSAFGAWLRDRGLPDAGTLGPRALGSACVMAQRASAAEQGAAVNKRNALPPVVPYGQTADNHFRLPVQAQCTGCPLDWEAAVDHDVQFAASCVTGNLDRLRRTRADALELLKELSRRLWPVSQALHSVQHPDVHSVNQQVHLALFAVCTVLFAWPDTSFVRGLLRGFSAVGYQPQFCTLEEALLEGRADADAVVRSLRPSADDAVACAAGEKDEQSGFCHPSIGWQELLATGRSFRLIRRFVITQASGKKRGIDDSMSGRQSEFSSDANKLQFCSAIQPCLHAQTLAAELSRAGISFDEWLDDLVTAGEDLPEAYRKMPMKPDHSWACVVAYHDCEAGGPRFRRYNGMLFGLPLAVSAFNRLPMFMQCVCRRLLRALVSMYFDDLTLQDWRSLAVETQQQVGEMFGFPFSPEKRQQPAATGDFLGLMHDFSTLRHGTIQVWVRQRLVVKILDIIQEARAANTLRPGQASKLFGCVAFLDQGVFGRVARAGLQAIKDRQYAASGRARLTGELLAAFSTIEAVLALRPERLVRLLPQLGDRVVAASDAAQDARRVGSGGLLLVTARRERLGAVVPIGDAVFDLWDDQDTKIAQLELLMVLQGLLAFPAEFRGASGVWYVDNIAALMALVRGRSDSPELDHMAQTIFILLFHLRCYLWFEWVPSASNWADGISRHGFRDTWWQSHRFCVHSSAVPIFLWQFPLAIRSAIFSFLA